MKYMTFNSSCSYAGIANMLEQYGYDTSDASIALTIKLPYMFSCCDGVYLSGPMLQGAQWFDLFLNPIGFQLLEKTICADELANYLISQKTAMLGIHTEAGGKHAVIYIGTEVNHLVFLNNKWETEESPNEIRLTEAELIQAVDPQVVVATLEQVFPKKVCLTERLQQSIAVLQSNVSEIVELSHKEESVENLRRKLNTLFRPLFLDGITMLNLIGETALSESFVKLQSDLLRALRQSSKQAVCLKEYIAIGDLQGAAEKYLDLIKLELKKEKDGGV